MSKITIGQGMCENCIKTNDWILTFHDFEDVQVCINCIPIDYLRLAPIAMRGEKE